MTAAAAEKAEPFLTISDAAAVLGVSDSFVGSLIRRGHLETTEKFGRRLLRRVDVLRRKRQSEAGKLSVGGPLTWKTTTPKAAANSRNSGKKPKKTRRKSKAGK